MRSRVRKTAVALMCGAASFAISAQAQTAPQRTAVDEYGMDLLSGNIFESGTNDISIGSGESELRYDRGGIVAGYDISSYFIIPDWPDTNDQIVNLGSTSVRMTWSFTNGVSTLTDLSGRGYRFDAEGRLVASDGTKYEFGHGSGTTEQNDVISYLTKIITPRGSVIQVRWGQRSYSWWNGEFTNSEYYDRIQSVSNNSGYILKFNYASDAEPVFGGPWDVLSSITASNQAVEYCDPDADDCSTENGSWPKVSYSRPSQGVLVVSGPGSRVRSYSSSASGSNTSYSVTGDMAENVSVATVNNIKTVTRGGSSVTYQQTGNAITRTAAGGGATYGHLEQWRFRVNVGRSPG